MVRSDATEICNREASHDRDRRHIFGGCLKKNRIVALSQLLYGPLQPQHWTVPLQRPLSWAGTLHHSFIALFSALRNNYFSRIIVS